LFKKSKNILVYALLICFIIEIQTVIINQKSLIDNGTIIAIKDNHLIIRNNGKHLVYVDNPEDYKVGIEVNLNLETITNDQKNLLGGFDYQRYLKSQGIFTVSRAKQIEVVKKQKIKELIPVKLSEYFHSNYSEKTAGYLDLFILGINDDLEIDLYQKTTNLGINHLFAISGMHLGLILAGFNLILNRLYLRKKTHRQIVLGFLILYNLITGFSISIFRASCLAYLAFYSHNKSFTKTDYLAFVFIGLIIINPFVIENIGFQLSFLISGSIILGSSLWKKDKKFIQVLKISFLANLVSLPIILAINSSLGLFNALYNPLFIYYVSYLFLPFSFITAVFPIFESIYLEIIILFEKFVEIAWDLNYYFDLYFTGGIFVACYWILLFYALINIKKIKTAVILSAFLMIFITNRFSQVLLPFSYVRVLDVNQGDAIHLHHGKYDILIDTGDEDKYDTLINYFKKLNIKDIDLLIITHFHSDHEKETIDLSNEISINKIVLNHYKEEYNMLNQLVVKEGEKLNIGPFTLLCLNSYNDKDENNNSLVFAVKIGCDNWLFTGDIEAKIEEKITRKYELDIDCLKVPHHGSSTSSTQDFLDAISSEYALISVGYNSYNHPDSTVINRLKTNNQQIYRTDQLGTITFYYYDDCNLALIETFKLNNLRKYRIKT
jgi:competence protein ComEC